MRFCVQKDSMQRIFIKNCFLFTVGSVCRVKRFTAGWQTFRWWRRVWNRGAEVAETTVKILLCCGFRRTGKAMGQVYQCWWRICREINDFSSRFEYHIFYVLYPFVNYLLTPPHIYLWNPTAFQPITKPRHWDPPLSAHIAEYSKANLSLCLLSTTPSWLVCGGVKVYLYHSWPRHWLEVSGQLHGPVTLLPKKEPPVPIG
jgi:hypothetical protein